MKKYVISSVILMLSIFVFTDCKKDGPTGSSTKEPPSNTKDPYPADIEDRYIVFFLTNTSVDQAASMNGGKDVNEKYTFVEEIPQIFGSINEDSPYKYAFGLPGPMLLTQSVEEMQYQVNKAFDLAEKYNVPVYFQLDDCNNYTTAFGDGATPKFYEKPEWSEWVSFPGPDEEWGGQSHGRLPNYWFNWGRWQKAEAFPCFQCPGFREFVTTQMQNGVLDPLTERYNKLVSAGKSHLFAGMAIGWETKMPDYSELNRNDLPLDPDGDQMQPWEATEYGYHSLYQKGYDTYNQAAIDTVIYDYIELLSKTAYDAGVPKEKIFSHIVGIRSTNTEADHPPIWTAVNDYSIPGFTMSPVTAPYDLEALKSKINRVDSSQKYFANAEGYSRGVNGSFDESDEYFDSMFKNGASLVTIFGWGRAAADSPFAVSHSPDNPFVIAASKWLDMEAANNHE